MSMDEGRDVYTRSPSAGSPAGWYPMYSGESLRARAFGGGPGPIMAWWTGEAWAETENDVLFSSRHGGHATRSRLVSLLPWAALLGAFVMTYAALRDSTSAWSVPAMFFVFTGFISIRWWWHGPAHVELTTGFLTFAHDERPDGVWTVPLASVRDVRVSRVWPKWCERSRIDVVLVDGGRLVARGVAGADVLHDLLVEHGVLTRDRVTG